MRMWTVISGVAGALAVGLAAYGAHGLPQGSEARALVGKATDYQLVHAVALVGAVALRRTGAAAERLLVAAKLAFLAGMVLFCGALYAIALAGLEAAAPVTPVGGVAFIVGWLLLAAAALWRPADAPPV